MVVWGTDRRVRQLMSVSLNCRNCQRVTVHDLRRAQKKFSLYFVPLVPLSTQHYLQCKLCGATSEVSKERAAELQQQKMESDQNSNRAAGPLPGDQPL